MNDTIWKAALNLGVPSVIAIFLIYFLTGSFTNQLSSLAEQVSAIESSHKELAEQIRLHSVDSSYILKEATQTKMILQQICVNTATDSLARSSCIKQ